MIKVASDHFWKALCLCLVQEGDNCAAGSGIDGGVHAAGELLQLSKKHRGG